jgi:predicted MPP superfamily phosphohydrolase
MLAKLEAPDGKFSILGNHDYGDYLFGHEPSAEKRANFNQLLEHQRASGFALLRNDHRIIRRSEAEMAIVGVENWGLPPFPQYGDLDAASDGLSAESFKILMSHDPSHWDAKVRHHHKRFHLTLAGHTHGMQFGVELGDFRWSPVKLRYPRWADLYDADGLKLYVNRGFGYLAFPGRVGIFPEITVLELRRGQA